MEAKALIFHILIILLYTLNKIMYKNYHNYIYIYIYLIIQLEVVFRKINFKQNFKEKNYTHKNLDLRLNY